MPETAMDVLCWMQTGHTRYMFTVRGYDGQRPMVPVRLWTYGYTP